MLSAVYSYWSNNNWTLLLRYLGLGLLICLEPDVNMRVLSVEIATHLRRQHDNVSGLSALLRCN